MAGIQAAHDDEQVIAVVLELGPLGRLARVFPRERMAGQGRALRLDLRQVVDREVEPDLRAAGGQPGECVAHVEGLQRVGVQGKGAYGHEPNDAR